MSRKERISAFISFGGKASKLDWLLPLLPQTEVYCEPFCGSCVVLLNRPKSIVEVANDINPHIIAFFRQLQNNFEELMRHLLLSPYSRAEYYTAKRKLKTMSFESELEHARCSWVVLEQSMYGACGGWATTTKGDKRQTVRYFNATSRLYSVHNRIEDVVFYNTDFEEVIKKYDSPSTLFYCDPPYPEECRQSNDDYYYETTNEDHIRLAELLNNIKGLAAVSSYRNTLYDSLFKDWFVYEDVPRKIPTTLGKNHQYSNYKYRQEVLYTNYDICSIKNDNSSVSLFPC